jgi:hypothetical protein
MDYPSHEPYYAHRFIRLLTKTAAAQELGPAVCWLLAIVAMQEDAKRYTEPAKWYLDQLAPLCGFSSKQSLVTAIDKAKSAGWLDYTPGSKGKPGRFFTTIPTQFCSLEDYPCDESIPYFGTNQTDETQKLECKRNAIGTNPERKSCASIPSPQPETSTPVSNDVGLSKVGRSGNYPETFEFFWMAYPPQRRQDKKATYRRWQSAIKAITHDAPEKWLIERARAYADSPIGKGEYAKSPEVWLNKGSYDDPPQAWGASEITTRLKQFVPSEERDPIVPRVRVAQ